MASDVARIVADDVLNLRNTSEPHTQGISNKNKVNLHASTETFTREKLHDSGVSEQDEVSSSSYILASDVSQLSGDVDRWIAGSVASSPTESTGVQGSRNVISSAEIFLHNIVRLCAKAKVQIQRMARDQLARDLFATAMDVVLIVYALGFLVLSMYQASMIG